MSAEKKAQAVKQAVKAVESQVNDLQKALIAPGSVRAAITTSGSPEGVSVADLSKQKPKTLRDLPKKAGKMTKPHAELPSQSPSLEKSLEWREVGDRLHSAKAPGKDYSIQRLATTRKEPAAFKVAVSPRGRSSVDEHQEIHIGTFGSLDEAKTAAHTHHSEGSLEKGIMSSIVAREAASMGAPKKPSESAAKLPTASRHEERANSYQSAMSGAFHPKGPMTPSGLELDRPKPKMPSGPRLHKAMTADTAMNKSHKHTLRSLLDRLSKGCAKAMAASCEPQTKHTLKSLLSKLAKKAAKVEPEVLSHQPTAHQEQVEVVKKSAENLKNLLSKLKK